MTLPLIVIPAAGSSKRFKDVGITTPKGLIEFSYAGSKPKAMIKHVVPYDAYNYRVITNDRQFKSTFSPERLQLIDNSLGQADTVRQFCELLQDQPILVLNSDVMSDYPFHAFVDQCRWAEAGVLVFEGHKNKAYSYIDQFPLFTNAREKAPISKWAIAGTYWFRSSRQLANAVHRQMEKGITHANEFYLSDTLNELDLPKLAVVVEQDQLHGWDTPEDLARDPNVLISDPQIRQILSAYK